MVAYSFQKQFAPPIAAYFKRQTIRGPRKRHAKVGEDLQLYVGMRTVHCTKIIPDPICTRVAPISIFFTPKREISQVQIENDAIDVVSDLDAFAIQDGFVDADDMAAFWFAQHKASEPLDRFFGYLISWEPKADAERLAA